MTIFLNDFTVYSDMEIIWWSSNFAFKNTKNTKSILTQKKCAFMVFLGLILGFIISKEGKIPYPKKVQAIVSMPIPTNPQQILIFNGIVQ